MSAVHCAFQAMDLTNVSSGVDGKRIKNTLNAMTNWLNYGDLVDWYKFVLLLLVSPR